MLIGSEGLLALVIPLLVGTWSDQLKSPIGGRLPFLVVATLALALALIGFASTLAIALGLAWLFFAVYSSRTSPTARSART